MKPAEETSKSGRKGADMIIDADTVLLPIDNQRGFDDSSWPRRWNKAAHAKGAALISAWRAAGRPIIHVRHDIIPPGRVLPPGHPGNAFRAGFEPLPGEPVVSKSVNSAFIGTDLHHRLRRPGASRIVAFGISTDMCVSTTIRTGANMGWKMVLVPDASDCFDLPDGRGGMISAEEVHRAHVPTLGFEFCELTWTEALLERSAPA